MGLDDIESRLSHRGPKADGNPILLILRIPIAVNGTLPLPLYHTRWLAIPSQLLSSRCRVGVELVVPSLLDVAPENYVSHEKSRRLKDSIRVMVCVRIGLPDMSVIPGRLYVCMTNIHTQRDVKGPLILAVWNVTL